MAQNPSGPVTIRIQPTEVIVPVSVVSENKFVIDLKRSDFRILDENVPQRITYFNPEPSQPVVFGFLLDLSQASSIHWKEYRDAAQELIWDLVSEKKHTAGYLITYNSTAELAMNTTGDGDALASKIEKLKPGGNAALYDAIVMACTGRNFVKGEPYEPRRVIVIIGDGHDTNSKWSLDQAIELAKRNDVTIFGLSTAAYGGGDVNAMDNLLRMATETGGIVQYPLQHLYKDISGYVSMPADAGNYVYEAGTGGYAGAITKGIIEAVGSIVGEVTEQYVLHYVPNVDPATVGYTYRHIKVDIPSLPTARVHAREGYYPQPADTPVK